MALRLLALISLPLAFLGTSSHASPSPVHGRAVSSSSIDLTKGVFRNARVVSGSHGNQAFQMTPDNVSGEASLTIPSQAVPIIRPGSEVVVKATYQALPSTLIKRAEELANCTLSIFLGGNLIFTRTIETTDGNFTAIQVLTTFPSGPRALILTEVCPPGIPYNVTIGGVTVGQAPSTTLPSGHTPPTGPVYPGTGSGPVLPPFNNTSGPSVGHPTPVVSPFSNHSSITAIIKTLPPFTDLPLSTISPIVTPIVYPVTSTTSLNSTVTSLPYPFRNTSSVTATTHTTSLTSRGVAFITAPPYTPGLCKWRPHNNHDPIPCGVSGFPDATQTGSLLTIATNLPGADQFNERVEHCAALCTSLTGCTSYFLGRISNSKSWTCKFYGGLDLSKFLRDHEHRRKFTGDSLWFGRECLVCNNPPPSANTSSSVIIPTPSSSSSSSLVGSYSLPMPTCYRLYSPSDSLACGIRGFDQPGHIAASARTRDAAGCAAYCQHLNDVSPGACASFLWNAGLETCKIWRTDVWNILGDIATGGAQYQRNTMDDFGCWFCPVDIEWFGVWEDDEVLPVTSSL